MDGNAKDRFADNPFYVLGLKPTCSRVEIEREGQRLLAMLELELSAALCYRTPVGERERTADKVRSAMAELRVPERRIVHELWARAVPAAGDARGRDGADGGGDRDGAGSPDPGDRNRDGNSNSNSNGNSDGDGGGEDPRMAPWHDAPAALGWRGR